MKKVKDLEGAELDYWVAKALGDKLPPWEDFLTKDGQVLVACCEAEFGSPSTDWSQGGPIIERERINGDGDLVAAMRSFVASKYGNEVDG